MKSIMMLLTILSISSCASIKRPVIKPSMLCDISIKHKRCRCRLYDLNNMEAIEEPEDFPVEQCEGITGFYIEELAQDILPKLRWNKRLCDDSNPPTEGN